MKTVCRIPACPHLTPCPNHGYTVVTGPPCAGKSTYILERMSTDDIIIDFDRIAQAISPKSPNYRYPEHVRNITRAMRLTAIQQAEDESAGHLWIIDTALKDHDQVIARHKRNGATVVELDPGEAVCIERAQRERPSEIVALVRQWYGRGG